MAALSRGSGSNFTPETEFSSFPLVSLFEGGGGKEDVETDLSFSKLGAWGLEYPKIQDMDGLKVVKHVSDYNARQ